LDAVFGFLVVDDADLGCVGSRKVRTWTGKWYSIEEEVDDVRWTGGVWVVWLVGVVALGRAREGGL
jgi:hypothetical protein